MTAKARKEDVSKRKPTIRSAVAETSVVLGRKICKTLKTNGIIDNTNVAEAARITGILAAKRTHELIPMCHQVPIDLVDIETEIKDTRIMITASVKSKSVASVEMEALTAVTIAALTVYDLCKTISRNISITDARLLEKTGGKSGKWARRKDK